MRQISFYASYSANKALTGRTGLTMYRRVRDEAQGGARHCPRQIVKCPRTKVDRADGSRHTLWHTLRLRCGYERTDLDVLEALLGIYPVAVAGLLDGVRVVREDGAAAGKQQGAIRSADAVFMVRRRRGKQGGREKDITALLPRS